jgi:hypothetical protein
MVTKQDYDYFKKAFKEASVARRKDIEREENACSTYLSLIEKEVANDESSVIEFTYADHVFRLTDLFVYYKELSATSEFKILMQNVKFSGKGTEYFISQFNFRNCKMHTELFMKSTRRVYIERPDGSRGECVDVEKDIQESIIDQYYVLFEKTNVSIVHAQLTFDRCLKAFNSFINYLHSQDIEETLVSH